MGRSVRWHGAAYREAADDLHSRAGPVAPLPGQGSALYVVGMDAGAQPKRVAVATGDPERLAECRWGSITRLVCLIYGQKSVGDMMAPGVYSGRPFESLVALSADGGDGVHPAKEVPLGFGFVADWLPNDKDEVLLSNLVRKNIVTGASQSVGPLGIGGVFGASFYTDGLGTFRVAETESVHPVTGVATSTFTYQYRDPGSTAWKPLSTYVRATGAGFAPHAVDPATNLAWGTKKVGGRLAVYTKSLDQADTEREVYSRPDVDVEDLVRIGRRRIVGVRYVTDATHVHYTDPALAALAVQLGKALTTPAAALRRYSAGRNIPVSHVKTPPRGSAELRGTGALGTCVGRAGPALPGGG